MIDTPRRKIAMVRWRDIRDFQINYDKPVVDPDKHVIGMRIREYRKMRKLSQEELGLAINSCQQEISKIELGEHLIGVKRLVRIANVLEVSVDEIMKDYRV